MNVITEMELADCPLCGPVLESIQAAQTIWEVSSLRRLTIPHTIGISHEQRQALLAAATEREIQIAENSLGLRAAPAHLTPALSPLASDANAERESK